MAAEAAVGVRRPELMWTYIQTNPPNHPIKVTPQEVTNSFIRSPIADHSFYKIIPGTRGQAQRTASSIQCSDDIKEEIRQRFTTFLRKIELSGCKEDFQIGIEARFGRQYQELWKDSEKRQPCTVAQFKPNLLTYKRKIFYTALHDGDDTRPLLEKYGVPDRKKEAKMISLDFKLFPNSQDLTYTALITEVEHGKFELKVVQHKPVDPDKIIGPTKHDIVLPGRKYDIRIAHKSGSSILSTTESLSYKAAEAITRSMERKCGDTSELTLILAGEVSDRKNKTKYFVKSIRYKVQTQYPWRGKGRLVLAKYDVKQRVFQESNSEAVGDKQCDIHFHPEDCREEIELWGEKIFPQDVDQTNPTRNDYLYMQSCVTPLQLEGEEEPVPPRPWQTAEELMEDFDDFLKAAFDVANALESMD